VTLVTPVARKKHATMCYRYVDGDAQNAADTSTYYKNAKRARRRLPPI
jgi:hypothetical protein